MGLVGTGLLHGNGFVEDYGMPGERVVIRVSLPAFPTHLSLARRT